MRRVYEANIIWDRFVYIESTDFEINIIILRKMQRHSRANSSVRSDMGMNISSIS